MRRPLLMPKLGLTMTEALLTDWLVEPGRRFKAGDGLFVVETEKVSNEIAAEADGVFIEASVAAGDTVPCGEVLGYWEDDLEGDADGTTAGGKRSSVGRDVAGTGRVIASPLARRIAARRGIDLASLRGSGPKGRIVARDVEGAAASDPASAAAPAATSASRLVKPTAWQATAARRLTAGKQQTPHFYLALEAQVARLMSLREELKEAREAVRLTVSHFIVAAVARALREMPQANRVWTDEGIVEFTAADVGIAVNTERGLVAPLLRDAGALRLAELGRRADQLVERARTGSLASADFEGGSITVSNAGMHHVTYMTSIINPGQSMILGVGSVRDVFRPDAAGQPTLQRELGLVLSVDHRVTDGVGALRFLNRIVDHLQHPARLLLD